MDTEIHSELDRQSEGDRPSQIIRNNVKVTSIRYPSGDETLEPFAFGLILDGSAEPNFAFFPPPIVKAYDIGPDDIGAIFDCVMYGASDQPNKKYPPVQAIYEADDPVQKSKIVDLND